MFADDYGHFYTRYNEPTHVKYVKISLLASVASDTSMDEITRELAEYVADGDVEMARRAIRAIGRIGLRLPKGANAVFEKLVELLELEIEYVRSETVLALKVRSGGARPRPRRETAADERRSSR